MNIIDLVTHQTVLLRLPTIYFGLPVIRSNGDFYSTTYAGYISSVAVDRAERAVMDRYHALGGSLDVVGMSLYYRQKINEFMAETAGTATLNPPAGVRGIVPTTAQYSIAGLCF